MLCDLGWQALHAGYPNQGLEKAIEITNMVSELLIGARGWQYAQWLTRFYPDDMPEDWQFSYYSNEFRTVLLPQAQLLAADADLVQDWHDDIDEEFTFFIELDKLDGWRDCLQRLAPIEGLVGGFVLRPEACTVSALAQCVPELQQRAPVCLDEQLVSPEDAALRQLIEQYQIGCCWDAQHDAPAWREGELSVALLKGGFDFEARQLRTVLENCLRNMRNKRYRALFVTAETITAETITAESLTAERDTADQSTQGEAGATESQPMSGAPSIDTLRQAIQLRELIE
jgi:hypothetical protein